MRILLTGAAGFIGSTLVEGMREQHQIRGFDRVPMPELEDAIVGDLADFEILLEAAKGVDAVIHLAAAARSKSPWTDVLSDNIIGTRNVLEAARAQSVKRVAFASSSQVINGYPPEQAITWDMRPRPVNHYAVSKVFGEMLGHMYATVYGLEVVCVRIGSFPRSDTAPAAWFERYLSPRDAVHLFEQAVTQPGVGFEIVFGTSHNQNCRFDLDHTREVLNYEPIDSADDLR